SRRGTKAPFHGPPTASKSKELRWDSQSGQSQSRASQHGHSLGLQDRNGWSGHSQIAHAHKCITNHGVSRGGSQMPTKTRLPLTIYLHLLKHHTFWAY